MLDLNQKNGTSLATPTELLMETHPFDREEFAELNSMIKQQYIDLQNLGASLLQDVSNEYLVPLFGDMLEYTAQNYTAVVNYDEALISSQKMIEVGTMVYNFLVIDAPGTIIPNYMQTNKIMDIEQLDMHIRTVLSNDSTNFKTSLAKTVIRIIKRLISLKALDKSVESNRNYKELLRRYEFYLELINYGDIDNFLDNYMRRMIIVNKEDIMTRL